MKTKIVLIAILVALNLSLFAQEEELLTNKSVISLVELGFESDVIITKILTSEVNFDLSVADLQILKEKNVPSDVIKTMLNSQHKPIDSKFTNAKKDNVKEELIAGIRFGNLIVADRNEGVNVPKEGVALNYTNERDHADHKNSLFKGDYYTWDEARTICPVGWRLPTRKELLDLSKNIQFSNGTAYVKGDNGKICYFPISGKNNKDKDDYGRFWSDEEYGSDITGIKAAILIVWANPLKHAPSGVAVSYARVGLKISVRCVKTSE